MHSVLRRTDEYCNVVNACLAAAGQSAQSLCIIMLPIALWPQTALAPIIVSKVQEPDRNRIAVQVYCPYGFFEGTLDAIPSDQIRGPSSNLQIRKLQ